MGCREGSIFGCHFEVDAPDHTWVGDITYIHTNEGWLYLAALLDLFNREMVGWATSFRLNRQVVTSYVKSI